jgi:hypothetical protein
MITQEPASDGKLQSRDSRKPEEPSFQERYLDRFEVFLLYLY